MTRLELATDKDLRKKRNLLKISDYEWRMVREFIGKKNRQTTCRVTRKELQDFYKDDTEYPLYEPNHSFIVLKEKDGTIKLLENMNWECN